MSPVTLQWAALGLCLVVGAVRVPGLVKGEGRAMFAVLALLSVAVGLSIEPIYLAVDALLGGVNVANLILRFVLYGVVVLLGLRMAAAFGSDVARRFVVGPFGLGVLALTASATLYFFIASELPSSSTGLRAFGEQGTVQQYAAVGRLYPGYVCAGLVLPAVAGVFDRSARAIHRLAAGFLASGFLLVVVFVVLRLTPVDPRHWDVVLPFSGILLTVVGLSLTWLSHVLGRRRPGRITAAQLTP